MTILVTNDDGIRFPGLWALVEALKSLDEVLVVAPEKERSGVGKAISFKVKIKLLKVEKGLRAYSISGTPADAVLISLNKLLNSKPKLLVSGVNGGPNLGLEDFFNSGTIGAAIEAALHYIPSIATSLALEDVSVKNSLEFEEFKSAVEYTKTLATKILREGMPEGIDLVNVNVPYKRKPLGVKVARLALHSYGDIHFLSEEDTYKVITWNMKMYDSVDRESDISVVKSGYISVTPISLKSISTLNPILVKKFETWLPHNF